MARSRFSTRLIILDAQIDLIVVNELRGEDEARSRLPLFTPCKVHRVHITVEATDALARVLAKAPVPRRLLSLWHDNSSGSIGIT